MNEKEMLRIAAVLKEMTWKPIFFNEIKLELLDVVRARHLPDSEFPKHHHPWFEFNYFAEGMFMTEMEGETFICRKGQALLIPPGAEHFQKSGPLGDDGICMRFQISAAKPEISEETLSFLERISESHLEALEVNMEILDSLGEGSLLNETVLLHFVMSICGKWQRETEKHPPKQLISNQAILYMEEYLQTRIMAEDVASALNMSYRSLARIFKKETGISIVEKLNELRINKARKLLSETELSISKIAAESGFENIHYFSNTFKKYMRTSPKQFRESHARRLSEGES